jgi:hypothetical protein
VSNTVKLCQFNKDDWSKYINILCVKRLSDGAVFRVGDKTNFGVITSFGVLNNIEKPSERQIQVYFNHRNDWQWLSCVQHTKTPLFKTEDGKEIFEGDKYYAVHKRTFQNADSIAKNSVNKWNFSNGDWELFSSQEKAEEFILLNKPCFSYNDIAKLQVGQENNYFYIPKKKLEELAIKKFVEKQQ